MLALLTIQTYSPKTKTLKTKTKTPKTNELTCKYQSSRKMDLPVCACTLAAHAYQRHICTFAADHHNTLGHCIQSLKKGVGSQ